MLSNDTLFIGIDPTSGKKEFGYAVLDVSLNLVTLQEADLEDVLVFLEEQNSVCLAVNAPSGINHGLVKRRFQQENPESRGALRGVDLRMAEYDLRERGIAVAGTPSREEFCPAWMQLGFSLHRHLLELGFSSSSVESTDHRMLETHPFACFCVLAESIPFPKPTLEGRLQRQSILFDKGLRIRDAMEFFEEITRFKLMKGVLPTDALYSPEQLDVMVAAYTAWLAINRPGEVVKIGDEKEGLIYLPVKELHNTY